MVSAPHEDFLDLRAFFCGDVQRDIGARFVIDRLSVAIVAVRVDHHATAGVGRAPPGGFAAESAEHD